MTDNPDLRFTEEQGNFEAVASILAAGLLRIPKAALEALVEGPVAPEKISDNSRLSTEIGLDLRNERSVDGADG